MLKKTYCIIIKKKLIQQQQYKIKRNWQEKRTNKWEWYRKKNVATSKDNNRYNITKKKMESIIKKKHSILIALIKNRTQFIRRKRTNTWKEHNKKKVHKKISTIFSAWRTKKNWYIIIRRSLCTTTSTTYSSSASPLRSTYILRSSA